MSDEPQGKSVWTLDASREDLLGKIDDLEKLMDRRFVDNDKAIQAALLAAKEAVDAALTTAKEAVTKAEVANDKRFDAANQVKKTFGEDLSKKLDRTEYDSNHKALEDKLDDLKDRINRSEGKGVGLNAGWGYLVGAIGIIAGLVALLGKL